jgi:hypothetical protein
MLRAVQRQPGDPCGGEEMVAHMLAVERRNTDFVPAAEFQPTGQRKPFLRRENIRITRRARCQVPQVTPRASGATPEALFGLFRDWQRTQTQSSVTALSSLRQQIDVRFCKEALTFSREAKLRSTKS